MNWSDCSIVETIPGKVSGTPIITGTRLPAQTIIDNFNAGVSVSDIADQYDVPLATVRTVIEFAKGDHASSPA